MNLWLIRVTTDSLIITNLLCSVIPVCLDFFDFWTKAKMLLEILYAVLLGVLVYILVNYIIHVAQLKRYPPGPIPLPVIGNLHQLGKKPYEALKALSKKYGDVMSISIGNQRVVVVNSIEPAKGALLRSGEDLSGRPQDAYPAYLISRGFQDIGFMDSCPKLRLMRKVAHASLKFYGNGLENLEKSILQEIDDLFERYDAATGKPYDPYNDIALAVINIICAIVYGHRYKREDEEFQRVVEHTRLIFQGLDSSSPIAFLPWLRFFPNEGLRKLRQGIAIRDELLERKIRDHRETIDPENPRDFTDALINEVTKENGTDSKTKTPLTDQNFELILSNIFIGGAETTTTMLHWCFAYLVTWPEVQQKIAEERKRVIGDRQPRLNDRGCLPYFESMIHETLRFSSLAPLSVPHKATRDTKIGKQSVPQGTQVWFNQWAIHHDEREWKEPFVFRPERWLDENGNLVPGKKRSYLPFGAGRRVCLGEALAKAELFLFLSNILHRYELKPSPEGLPDLEGELGITYSPKLYHIVLEQRC